MNIDVYFNASPLLGPRTGIGQYCLQLLSELRKDPTIHSHYFYRGKWSEELVTRPGETTSAVRRSKLLLAEKFPNLANFGFAVRQLQNSMRFSSGLRRNSASVYHEPNFLAFRSKLPTVVTVHDLSVLRYPETHPKYRVAVLGKRIAESAKRADCIITDSEYVRQEVIAEFGLPPEQVVSVLLAAADAFVPIGDDAVRTALSSLKLESGKYVLAVGTLEPRKNLDSAIKAYACLRESIRKEFPFVIVGMKGWRMESLDRQIRSLIESGQIRRLGYVPDEMLPVLYSGARVFVYPSLYEGFGLPPLEAMACGAPVIVSDRSSLPEVVGDAGLQVAALDVDALAAAILSVIEDDALSSSLGRRGVERAASFSWRRCAQQTAEVYRRVIA